MNAINLYRAGNFCYKHKIPVIPKLFFGLTYLLFNSYVPYQCNIDKGTKLGYGGMSVVIHKNAKIGKNCIIGTCVTIGGNKPNQGIPTIEDNCYIATGAKIFGGVTIGKGSFIGSNSVVTSNIPARSLVSGIPGKVIKENIDINDYSTHIDVIK